MSDMEAFKKEFIEDIYGDCIYYCFSEQLYTVCNVDSYESYFEFMNSKTFDEIVNFTRTAISKNLKHNSSSIALRKSLIDRVKYAKKELQLNKITNEIATIKDNVQNTVDIVNLFIDIEKNRTNTDNRMDKLENSINQLVNILQKS